MGEFILHPDFLLSEAELEDWDVADRPSHWLLQREGVYRAVMTPDSENK